jgi:hypothetical protein
VPARAIGARSPITRSTAAEHHPREADDDHEEEENSDTDNGEAISMTVPF